MPLWTVGQVCAYLNVGKTTVYELMKKGELKAIKVGKATRFNPAQVLAWVGSQ
jgi:excisionase family DNA binding protein